MFDIFDALALIGGLCLFLFGMNIMGDGLERRAGNSLKALLGKLTDKHLKAGNAHYNEKFEEYSSKYSVVKLV